MKKFIFLYLFAVVLFSCEDPYEGESFTVAEAHPNAEYLSLRSEEFSMWVDLLNYTDLYNAANNANTSITLFAPKNEAVQQYLSTSGYSSVQDIPLAYAKELVKYHMIEYGVTSAIFQSTEGYLTYATVLGSYLNVHTDDTGGATSMSVNNEAAVLEIANETTNGYVYVIDHVLTPLVETILDRFEEMPDYSFFTSLLRETGWDKELDTYMDTVYFDTGGSEVYFRNYTVFGVRDSIFERRGINTLSDLLEDLNVVGDNFTDTSNGLYQYVAYHIINTTVNYKEAFASSATDSILYYDTEAENAIVSLSEINDGLYRLNYNYNTSTGIEFLGEISARNGILYDVNSYMPIEEPTKTAVIWDLTNYSDIEAYVNAVARDRGWGSVYQNHALTPYSISLNDNNAPMFTIRGFPNTTSFPYVAYCTTLTYLDDDGNPVDDYNEYNAYFNDYLQLSLGFSGSITIPTPTIPKGTYNVDLYYIVDATTEEFVEGGSLCKFNIGQVAQVGTAYETSEISTYYMYEGTLSIIPDRDDWQMPTARIFSGITFEETMSHDLQITLQDSRASSNSNYRLMLDRVVFTPL